MAAVFSKQTIENVRARSDIADIVGRYCRLQRSGSGLRALCPFHREKTPSFHVSPDRQAFHCFGCGKGGDVFRFVMEYENIDFPEAVRMLAEWAGVPLETETRTAATEAAGPRKDRLYRLHAELAQWYRDCLLRGPMARAAREYLKARELPPEIMDDFAIGYADGAWDTTLAWGAGAGFSLEELSASGVIARSERDGRRYDRFRDRIMFPIRDEQGRVIAFSGRALASGTSTAKYINSPETALFRKNRVLFGLDRARRAIVESREALVCEGQIDVIRCHAAGFQGAVAPQGTAFTEEHAVRVARLADGAALVFDADDAGHEAAVKTAMICLQHGLTVRVVALPPGEDPDSLIRSQGANAFEALLAQAVDVLDFRLDRLLQRENAATPIGMRAVVRGLAGLIEAARDPLERERMLQRAARRLVIDPEALQGTFRRSAPTPPRARTDTESAARTAPPPVEEAALIETLAADPALLEIARAYMPSRLLRDPRCRKTFEIMLAANDAGESDLMGFCSRTAPDDVAAQSLLAAAIMAPPRISGGEFSPGEAVRDLILKIWRRRLDDRLKAMLRERRPDADGGIRMECAHLRADIQGLARWETGAAIIEMLRDETR